MSSHCAYRAYKHSTAAWRHVVCSIHRERERERERERGG